MEVQKQQRYGTLVAVICFGIFFIGNYAQYQITILAPQIMETLQINAAQYGQLFTVCMFPALVLSLVAGLICDRFGTKATVFVALALSTVGIIGRIFASTYPVMLICMGVLGLGCMLLTTTVAKILAPHFAPQKLGSVLGLVFAGNTVGMILATATTAWFPNVISSYMVAGVLAVVVLLSWAFLIKPDKKSGSEGTAQGVPMLESLGAALRNPHIWLCGLTLLALMVGNVVLASFLPQALMSKGMDAKVAGYMTSTFILGNILGSAFGPRIFYRLNKGRRRFLSCCTVLFAAGVIFAWNLADPLLLAAAMVICGASIGVFVPLIIGIPVTLPGIGPTYAATAGGLSATIQIIGATIIPTYIIIPMFAANFGVLFLVAGCVSVVALVTVNLLPIFIKS